MNVTFTRSVTALISLNAHEWEIYDQPGAKEAAATMNKALEIAIANSRSADEALKLFFPTMRQFSSFGACDTEPLWVARRICCEAFGEEA